MILSLQKKISQLHPLTRLISQFSLKAKYCPGPWGDGIIMVSLFHNSSIKGHPHLMLGHLHSLQNHRLKVLLFVLWKERGELSDCISYIKIILCHEGRAVAWLGAMLQLEKSPAPKSPWSTNGRLWSSVAKTLLDNNSTAGFFCLLAVVPKEVFKHVSFRQQSLSKTILHESEH